MTWKESQYIYDRMRELVANMVRHHSSEEAAAPHVMRVLMGLDAVVGEWIDESFVIPMSDMIREWREIQEQQQSAAEGGNVQH
jgi:hypothetical protein